MAILAYDDVMLREPNLLIPRQPPVGSVSLVTDNIPLASKLRFFAVVQGEQLVDLTRHTLITKVGSAITRSGSFLRIGAHSNYFSLSPSIVSPGRSSGAALGKRTYLVMFAREGTNVNVPVVPQTTGAGTQGLWCGNLTATAITANDGIVDVIVAADAVAVPVAPIVDTVLVTHGNANDKDTRVYKNGNLVFSTTAVGDAWTAMEFTTLFGSTAYPSLNYYIGLIGLVALWDEKMPDAAARALSYDPFSVVRPA